MGDNNTLKMKFKLNQMEFELEGNQDIVTKQFENFKAFVTDDLLPRINNTVYNEGAIDKTNTQVQLIESKDTNSFEELPIPSLKEIALKGLPKLIGYSYIAILHPTLEKTHLPKKKSKLYMSKQIGKMIIE